GDYYKSGKYDRRGDCIYEFKAGRFRWRRSARNHGPKDLTHDLGKRPRYPRAVVLLSADFRYFGKSGDDQYKSEFSLVKWAVEHLGRSHRVWHEPGLRAQLLDLIDWL